MYENNELCFELNEIIYNISGEFWKQAYENLLYKQKAYKLNQDIAAQKTISELRKDITTLAKKSRLKCNTFSHNNHFYMSLVPYPIYIGIDCESGDFSISAPHISTKHFTHSEYKSGIKWIQDYMDIDIKPLTAKIETVHEKFYLSTKSSEIVGTSIKVLCESILEKKAISYKIHQSRLKSIITIVARDTTVYEIEAYHKPFAGDSSILINLLNNLHKENIEDVISCTILQCYGKENKI